MPVYEKTAGGYFYKTLKTTNKKVRISEEEFKRNNKNGKEVRGGANGNTNNNKKKYAFDCVCSPAKNKNITLKKLLHTTGIKVFFLYDIHNRTK